MPIEVRIPIAARRAFTPDTLRMAVQGSAGSEVVQTSFLRSAYCATVIERGQRRYAAEFLVRPDGTIGQARCGCTEQMRDGDLCRHLALAISRFSDTSSVLAGERFEASLWRKVGEALHEAHGSAVLHESSDGVHVTRSAAGEVARLASGSPALATELSHLHEQDGGAAASARLQRLRRLAITEQERKMLERGVPTRRQQWEASFWYRLSRFCFEHVGDAVQLWWTGAGFELECGREDLDLRTVLPRAAVEIVLGHDDGAIARLSGMLRDGDVLQPSLRLELDDDGRLHLYPVLLNDVEEPPFLERAALEPYRFGRCYFLTDRGRFIGVAAPPPLFAQREAGQQSLLFGGTARGSAAIPFDRHTVIPESEVLAFVDRHRSDIAELPQALVPDALRGAAAVRADRTVLRFAPLEGETIVLAVDYWAGAQRIASGRIASARRAKRRSLSVGTLWLDVSAPEFAWMDATVKETDIEWLRLSKLDYVRLRSHVRGTVEFEGDESARETFDRFETQQAATEAPLTAELGLDLYGYQLTGYQWLWFLQQNGFGGLLCDDMGLGKTHQAMALIRALTLGIGGDARTFLIVCPTSLLDHWQDKLRQYVPDVAIETFYGAGRRLPAAQVVITTYGTLRNSVEQLAGRWFDVMILDEIQSIKNRATATFQELARVQRRVAIGLTGTPLENRVGELKTLLDFVVPGYLPGDAEFERTFARPAEKGSIDAVERLRRLTSPFMLRRTKSQVLTELPAKIVDRRHCELTPEQKEIYREVIQSRGRSIRSLIARRETLSYVHVFAVLSHLKQVCNHPAIVGRPECGSGKWDLFRELLGEAIESGLKVVVFSQYVKMLTIIEAYLDEQGIGFATIKGDTRNRGAMVERFRTDPDCRVFTASLRAGGVGIDLTAASVVIHYDRWWNQAREDQATDRVHRIGQSRGVQVIKLITRGTIEEKIDRMIEAKARLASGVIHEDDPTLEKQFSVEEIDEMLSWE
ncbi:MAG: DEAD/DEAH box helicase [Thermoanaerobaculia bacterium]